MGTIDAGNDFFVLSPSDVPAPREDRPPAGWSLARLALTIAMATIALVLAASAIGFLLKVQLDQYFRPAG